MPLDEAQLNALRFVEENYERIGSQVAVRTNVDRYRIAPDDLCIRLRDVTIDKITDGTYDPARPLENYMYAIAANVSLEMIRAAIRRMDRWHVERSRLPERFALIEGNADPPDLSQEVEQSYIHSMMDDSPAAVMDRDEIAIRNILEENLLSRRGLWDEAKDEASDQNLGQARKLVRHIACRDFFDDCRPCDRFLIYRHYWQGQPIIKLASELGVSVDSLYKRNERIKERISKRFIELCRLIPMPAK